MKMYHENARQELAFDFGNGEGILSMCPLSVSKTFTLNYLALRDPQLFS